MVTSLLNHTIFGFLLVVTSQKTLEERDKSRQDLLEVIRTGPNTLQELCFKSHVPGGFASTDDAI